MSHKHRAIAPLALALISLAGCGETPGWNAGAVQAQPPDALEAAVIGDIIYEFFAREEAPSEDITFIVVTDTIHNARVTEFEQDSARREDQLFREWVEKHGLKRGTVEAYIGNNLRSWRLPNEFRPPMRYRLISKETIGKSLYADDGWQKLQEMNPGKSMLVNVSRAGIDEGSSQALLFLFWEREPECGGGHLIFAEKVDGKWKIVAEQGIVAT